MRDGWRELTLGDVASVNPERTPSWPQDRPIRYIDLSTVSAELGIRLDSVSKFAYGDAPGRARRLVRANDVLVATVRPYLRGFAVVPADLDGEVASTGFAVLRAQAGVVLPEYLWCLVRTDDFVDGLMARATGSNYPAVRPEDVAAQPVSLPPLIEQRRIVDLIGALDKVLSATATVVARLDQLLVALVEERVFEPDHAWMTLEALALSRGVAGGPFGSNLTTRDFTKEGVPVIQGSNLSASPPYVSGPFKYVSSEKARTLPSNLAQPGDLIVTQRGTLGQVGLIPDDAYPSYVVSQSQMRLRVDPARASAKFAYLALSSPRLVAEVLSQKIATANPHINLGIFSRLQIPVPPLADQARTVDLAFSILAQKQAAQATAKSVSRLRSALAVDLLAGAHRLPTSYDRLLDSAA